jgi:phosphoglycerol transferase MdoB-like AlkP superfamily enzyme
MMLKRILPPICLPILIVIFINFSPPDRFEDGLGLFGIVSLLFGTLAFWISQFKLSTRPSLVLGVIVSILIFAKLAEVGWWVISAIIGLILIAGGILQFRKNRSKPKQKTVVVKKLILK